MIDNKGRPKGAKNVKMSNIQKQLFLDESMDLILRKHMSWTDYVGWVKKQGLGEQRANQLWKEVWDLIRDRFSLERDKQIQKHLLHYWSLYDKAMSNDELNTARQTLNDIVKLIGLAEPDKVDLTTKGEVTFRFGDE